MIDEIWLTVENNGETCVCVCVCLAIFVWAPLCRWVRVLSHKNFAVCFRGSILRALRNTGNGLDREAGMMAGIRSAPEHCCALQLVHGCLGTTSHHKHNLPWGLQCVSYNTITSNQTQVHKIYPLLINHPDLLCPRWPQPSMMCQRTSHTLPLLGSSTPLCRSGNLTRHVMPYDGTYLLYIVQGLIWDQPKLCPYLDTEPKALSRINASLYLPKLFVYVNTTVPSNSQHRDKNHHRSCYERGAASLLICSKRVCFRKEILSHALFMTNILM